MASATSNSSCEVNAEKALAVWQEVASRLFPTISWQKICQVLLPIVHAKWVPKLIVLEVGIWLIGRLHSVIYTYVQSIWKCYSQFFLPSECRCGTCRQVGQITPWPLWNTVRDCTSWLLAARVQRPSQRSDWTILGLSCADLLLQTMSSILHILCRSRVIWLITWRSRVWYSVSPIR